MNLKSLRTLLGLMFLQLALLSAFLWDLNQGPINEVHMVARTQGIYIKGTTKIFNVSSIKFFKNWNEFHSHLKGNNFEIPTPDFALISGFRLTKLENQEHNNRQGFLIELKSNEGQTMLLQAPDHETAKQLIRLAEHRLVQPGDLGFSVQVRGRSDNL